MRPLKEKSIENDRTDFIIVEGLVEGTCNDEFTKIINFKGKVQLSFNVIY